MTISNNVSKHFAHKKSTDHDSPIPIDAEPSAESASVTDVASFVVSRGVIILEIYFNAKSLSSHT